MWKARKSGGLLAGDMGLVNGEKEDDNPNIEAFSMRI
jgi:hypothetical protein